MRRALAVLAALSMLSCAGGSAVRIKAPESGYPISMTSHIVDERGKVYDVPTEDWIGQFTISVRHWTWLLDVSSWSSIKVVNISRRIAAEVEKQGGNAVVGLAVSGRYPKISAWTPFILPRRVVVEVTGVVVRIPEEPTEAR